MDLSYIAGFFDGEGSIVLTREGKKGRIVLNVVVVQTDRMVLELIKAKLDCKGGIYNRSRAGSLGNKPVYALQWANACGARVLEKLLPYLLVKRGRAEIALEFQATMSNSYRGKGVPAEIMDMREELQRRMKLA